MSDAVSLGNNQDIGDESAGIRDHTDEYGLRSSQACDEETLGARRPPYIVLRGTDQVHPAQIKLNEAICVVFEVVPPFAAQREHLPNLIYDEANKTN